MSKLYVSADTDAIKTTRTARAFHHASAHVRGWESGIQVNVMDDVNVKDHPGCVTYSVYMTSGSNANRPMRHLVSLIVDETTGDIVHTDSSV